MKFSPEEIELIEEVFNQHWHTLVSKLSKKDGLGDIERRNMEGELSKCQDLMKRINDES